MEEGLATQLRRQVAQASGEREAAARGFASLRGIADSHLLRFQGLLAGSSDLGRLTGAVRALDADLGAHFGGALDAEAEAAAAPGEGPPSESTFEVLRDCLSDAQKRCQYLNSDMLRVADANEELHSTLRTLKGTNKRLIEEVQKQTEELSGLTQQRLVDMENLGRLEEALRQERAAWAQEAERGLGVEQRRCDEEFAGMRERLALQLSEAWTRARAIASKASALVACHRQLKADFQSFAHSSTVSLRQLEHELLDRIILTAKQFQDEESQWRDRAQNTQVKLCTEKELRAKEVEGWKGRHEVLAGELADLSRRREGEVAELQAKAAAAAAEREAERAAGLGERSALQEKVEVLAREVALLEAKVQTARRRCLHLETEFSQGEGERDRQQSVAEALRQQIQESDQALNGAVRSNELLREQMEVQRLEAQAANDKDLKFCWQMFEKRLETQAATHAAEQADLAKRLWELETNLGQKAGELQAVRAGLAEATRTRDAMRREVLLWGGQHELAAKTAADVKQEFTQFRQERMANELRPRQEQHEELCARRESLEARRCAVAEEAEQLEQAVKAQGTSDTEQSAALAAAQREAAEEVRRAREGLQAAEGGLAAARAEAAAAGQQLGERREALEQELQRAALDVEEEQRDFERRIQAERLSCEGLKESLKLLQDQTRSSCKATIESPVKQISALEGTISGLQRSADSELAGLRQQSERLRARLADLEAEVGEARARLARSEHEVQESTARVTNARAHNRAAREALERERATSDEEAQRAQRAATQRSEQLRAAAGAAAGAAARSGEEARRKLLLEAEGPRSAKAADPRRCPQAPSPRGETQAPQAPRAARPGAEPQEPREPFAVAGAREPLAAGAGPLSASLENLDRSGLSSGSRAEALAWGNEQLRRPPMRSEGTRWSTAGAGPLSASLENLDRSGLSSGSRAEAFAWENEQLRRYVGEHRLATGHLQDLGAKMKRSLASMEDRAVDLRRGLSR